VGRRRGNVIDALGGGPWGSTMLDAPLEALLKAAERGDAVAREHLFASLYDELHRLASRELRRGGSPFSLSATTVLHESFLQISNRPGLEFPDRARFMAYAARAMRGLIIDYARHHHAQKRGGEFNITSLKTDFGEIPNEDLDLARIGDALDEMAKLEPVLAEVVDLKFFCGLSHTEIAAMRGCSERTVQRDWEKARMYLYRSLNNKGDSDSKGS